MATPMPYDPAVGAIILDALADGQSLRKVCKTIEGIPSPSTIFKWLSENPEFAEQYARSREAQADALFDETLDIADETKEDYVKRLNFDGPLEGWEVNGEAIARSRLRIDTRKWMAGKLRPKKYGEKLDVEQKVSVSDPLMSLIERVANSGNRLVPGMELPKTVADVASSLGAVSNNFASEAENDGTDQS